MLLISIVILVALVAASPWIYGFVRSAFVGEHVVASDQLPHVKVLQAPSHTVPGRQATLEIACADAEECEFVIQAPSGESVVPQSFRAEAFPGGRVRWEWTVPDDLGRGRFVIIVTAFVGRHKRAVSIPFEVADLLPDRHGRSNSEAVLAVPPSARRRKTAGQERMSDFFKRVGTVTGFYESEAEVDTGVFETVRSQGAAPASTVVGSGRGSKSATDRTTKKDRGSKPLPPQSQEAFFE